MKSIDRIFLEEDLLVDERKMEHIVANRDDKDKID